MSPPEQDANELHHLPVARPVVWLLVAGFLLLVVGRPLLLLRGSELGPVFATAAEALVAAHREAPTARRLNERIGKATRSLETNLQRVARFTDRVLPWWQRGLVWLGTGNETVYVGVDGWLEFRDALDYVIGRPFLDRRRLARTGADPRPALLAFVADLRRQGIALWLLPVPGKVTVYPESFARGVPCGGPGLDNPSFPELRRELEAAGIRVLDPLPTLCEVKRQGLAYLKTDSHWAPAAIDRVAAWLAAALEADGGLAPRDREWRCVSQPQTYPGDLVRLLDLAAASPWPMASIATAVVTDSEGRAWAPDPRAQVLLLGDSFANIFAPAGGFPALLAHHLGRPVDRMVVNGGGAGGNREQLVQELLADPQRLAATKVVVLELAARELATGTWSLTPLPPTAASDRTVLSAP